MLNIEYYWDKYFVISKISSTFALAKQKQETKHRGVEQLVARQAHNLEVARSSPASATLTSEVVDSQHFGRFPVFMPDTFRKKIFGSIGCGRRTM